MNNTGTKTALRALAFGFGMTCTTAAGAAAPVDVNLTRSAEIVHTARASSEATYIQRITGRRSGTGWLVGERGDSFTATPAIRTLADRVEQVRTSLGLTAEQVAALFDVSRRSVNNWLAGRPMGARHQEVLDELERLVTELPGDTPDERRDMLFSPLDGTTLYQQLRSAARGAALQEVGLSIEELV